MLGKDLGDDGGANHLPSAMFLLDIRITFDIGQHRDPRAFTLKQMNHAVPSFALEIRGLAKSFEQPAVDGLDLRVRTGEFYTLLGPNGAGKTTTLRMVTGLLKPDRGSITVFGMDAFADPIGVKKAVAWLGWRLPAACGVRRTRRLPFDRRNP
jgi:ABC-type transport system involved in cytochrome bd biosynthesis fused ATPase/permease subunit